MKDDRRSLYEGRSAKPVSMDKAEPSDQPAQKPGVVVKLTHKTPKIRLNSDSRLRLAESSHSADHAGLKVLQEYFNTMDNFLSVQQKIMKTFVEKKGLAKRPEKEKIKK